MASRWKGSYFGLYLVLALQNEVSKINDRRPGLEYFKNHLTVSSNNTCSVKAVPAKQEEE